jgi:hypothetical protein
LIENTQDRGHAGAHYKREPVFTQEYPLDDAASFNLTRGETVASFKWSPAG